jgi:hypothetical protein
MLFFCQGEARMSFVKNSSPGVPLFVALKPISRQSLGIPSNPQNEVQEPDPDILNLENEVPEETESP